MHSRLFARGCPLRAPLRVSPNSLCPLVTSSVYLVPPSSVPISISFFFFFSYNSSLPFMPLALIVLLDYISSFAVKPSRNSTDIPLLVAFIFIRKYLNFTGSSSGNYCLSCLIRASFGFSFLPFAEFVIPGAISTDP